MLSRVKVRLTTRNLPLLVQRSMTSEWLRPPETPEIRPRDRYMWDEQYEMEKEIKRQRALVPPLLTAEWFVYIAPKWLQPYLRLSRIDKPIGSWLLFWPGAWALAMTAPGYMYADWRLLALFGAGSIVMRGVGCTINDILDKKIDVHVERTKNRPLAAGELTNKQAYGWLATQLAIGLPLLLQLEPISWAVGAAALPLIATYPLVKRHSALPQLFLGITFNWPILVAFTHMVGSLQPLSVSLPLYLAGVAWTVQYDTIYARQDMSDDQRVGVRSTAILW
eukprot:GHVL01021163.1.p2 GENE.GHVL01021163.1~~GHVL01021163.1.p2  ORF type:complete len:279 (+),score=35.07 GHVL01021163.1:1191-2027(+)